MPRDRPPHSGSLRLVHGHRDCDAQLASKLGRSSTRRSFLVRTAYSTLVYLSADR